jgi:polyisoprenoid-binding protein YceI
MTDMFWTVDASAGELRFEASVTGWASRDGHRLSFAMTDWWATGWQRPSGELVALELTVNVNSLQVLHAAAQTPRLWRPEKLLIRSLAVSPLDADRFSQILFYSDDVARKGRGYRLAGILKIHGQTRRCEIDLRLQRVGESTRASCKFEFRQTDFDLTPFSLGIGSVEVADNVTVSLNATRLQRVSLRTSREVSSRGPQTRGLIQ